MSFVPKLAILLLALVAGGCSQTKILYENADWLAHRWASRLVDASTAQREAWRGEFGRMLEQHRDRLLPDVVALLDALAVQARAGLTVDGLICLAESADRLYRAHARLAAPLAARVLAEITPEQVTHLARQLEERNREYAADYLPDDPTQRRAERIERYVERIERWTGNLSRDQVALVDNAISVMPEIAADWLAYRRQQQDRLIRLLRETPVQGALQSFITAWWVDLADRPAELAHRVEQIRRKSVQLAVRLNAALTPAQRTHFLQRVGKLRDGLKGVDGFPLHARTDTPLGTCGWAGRSGY